MINAASRSTAVDTAIHSDVASAIDRRNHRFIASAKARLRVLSPYSTEALEWLMVEHYQFSFANTRFLATAAKTTRAFDSEAVAQELVRNCAEEDGHAVMYKAALRKVGVDVEARQEFPATTAFLATIGRLVDRPPSAVLGTMFATETAAIFEHEVFLDISREVIARRESGLRGKALIYFHEMHLSGVEQSHRDELGIFLREVPADQALVERVGERPTIAPPQALDGATQAIEAMEAWWADLFAELDARSSRSVAS
jgi:hypothetical protein